MAVLALAAAGSMIGGAIGGTFLGVTAAAWGWSIGAMLGNVLFPPKTPDQHFEGPRYNDLKIIASEYGRAIPIIFGAYPTAGNIIASSEVREVATTSSQEVGGKGGGGSTVTSTSYAYYADFAVLLGEGVLAGVRKIKFQGELKFNVADDASTQTIVASSLNAKAVRFYPGSETQDVDPILEALDPDTPAYRGYSYIVFENFDLTPYGGKLPQMEFEVVSAGSTAATLNISTGDIVTNTLTGGVSGLSNMFMSPNGDVLFEGNPTNTAVRVNFHTKNVQSKYSRATWGFIPCSLHPNGKVIFVNYGGYLGWFNEDGTYTEYSAGPGILGANGGIAWEDEENGFAQGDGGTTVNLYRFRLNKTTMQIDETLLTSSRSIRVFKNGCGIPGRCYVYGDSTYSHDVGYINSSNSKVLLFSGTAYNGLGLLVSRDGYLWMALNSSAGVEKRTSDGVLITTVALPGGVTPVRLYEANDGYIWVYTGSGAMHAIHPTLFTVDYTTVAVGTKTPLGFTSDNRFIFASTSGTNVLLHETEPLPRLTATSVTAASVVSALLQRTQLTAPDLSLSAIGSDTVRGYAVGRRMTARAAVEPLLAAFRAELVESDDVLKAVKRGGAVAMTIDEDDLGAHAYGADPVPAVVEKRTLESELPSEVWVEYPDAAAGYEVGAQYARRLVGGSRESETVSLGLVMTGDEAQQLAEILLYDRWVSRNTYQINLPRKYSRLEPTDIINVPSLGNMRILNRKDADGVLTFDCVAEDVSVYAYTGVGGVLPAAGSEVSQAGPTILRILDIPLLRDIDDGTGFYVAASGYYPGWLGAELWRSTDGGTTFSRTDTAMLEASTMGSAITALGNAPTANVFDEANSVDVQLLGGTLSSATATEVLNGANAAYLAGEIIQFKTATLIGTNQYRLSGLLRARRGTEQYMATHQVGDSFVFLNTANIYRVVHSTADIGIERVYKAPSLTQLVSEATPMAFTSASVGQKCLAPVGLAAGRTANASWDISGKWIPRTRIGGEWRNGVDATMGEATEDYVVEIWTAAFAALKRTITTVASGAGSVVTPGSRTFLYKSADQVTDFGSNQTTIYVKVYQLSAVTGRGFPAQGTLTV